VIVCRSQAELERMREAGRLVGEVLTELAAHVEPGVSTGDLDALAEKRIRQAGATPAFRGTTATRRRSARRSTTRSSTVFRPAGGCCSRAT
jgi:methionine aminopeptidase